MADQFLHLPPVNPQSLQPIDSLVVHLSSMLGGEDDIQQREMALRFLDRAADRLNLGGVYLWTLREASDTLTTGDSYITLPADFIAPYGQAFVHDSDGGTSRVTWMPWDTYTSYNRTDTGSLKYLTIRSDIYDGVAYTYPKIDSGDNGKTLRYTYYAKVQRPSEASDLYLAGETREALLTGAVAFLVQWRNLNNPNIWAPLFADFELQMQNARAAGARRMMDGENLSFGVDMSFAPVWPATVTPVFK